jgi:hypothetical protein
LYDFDMHMYDETKAPAEVHSIASVSAHMRNMQVTHQNADTSLAGPAEPTIDLPSHEPRVYNQQASEHVAGTEGPITPVLNNLISAAQWYDHPAYAYYIDEFAALEPSCNSEQQVTCDLFADNSPFWLNDISVHVTLSFCSDGRS